MVNRFADALRIVAESDLLTCVPSGFLQGHGRGLVAGSRLVLRDLPFSAETLLYKLVWHERLHTHPAHRWFRSLVAEICGWPPTLPGKAFRVRRRSRPGRPPLSDRHGFGFAGAAAAGPLFS